MSILQITPASQWRNRHVLTLPSGKVGEFRKIDLMSLLMEADKSEVPNFLRVQVIEELNNPDPNRDRKADKWQVTPENMGEFNQLVVLFVKGAFVSPAIKAQPNYEAGEISIDDVTMEDRLFVFNWCMPKEVAQAADFLQGPAPNVASAQPSAPVREETQPDPRVQELVG